MDYFKRKGFTHMHITVLAAMVFLYMVATTLCFPLEVFAETNNSTVQSLFTKYQPTVTEVIDDSGFLHPGVGITKDILENARIQVQEQKEPWYSGFVAMTKSTSAAKNVESSNKSVADPKKPNVVAFNSTSVQSMFISDSLKAYTQALMYYFTGDEIYRSNAIDIIRIWSQMDPTKYAYYTDACIHTGIPMYRMVTAAEILRYTSCNTDSLTWTDMDTANFTNNLVTPLINTLQYDQNHFMNQHLYSLMGATAGYIFTGNKSRYEEAVEWFTVNKTAVDQGMNGSIKQMFRLVDTNVLTGEKVYPPVVQHMEMGRDQAHGGGDLTNAAIIARMLYAQGTKVDPVEGTVSTAANALNSYQFLNNRILEAEDYFWQYMLGYDTDWIPVADHIDPDGTITNVFRELSPLYRGRLSGFAAWDVYYHYKYNEGVNMEQEAPYFSKAFEQKVGLYFYWGGTLTNLWDFVDGGGDYWLYVPKVAEAEGANNIPRATSDTYIQFEDRYNSFDLNSSTMQDGETSYIEINATESGSKLVACGVQYPKRDTANTSCIIGLRFRTNGTAVLEGSSDYDKNPYIKFTLPDTKGEWQYITYDMATSVIPFTVVDVQKGLLFLKVKGSGTTVDIDCLNLKGNTQLSPPVFKSGNADMNLNYYVGAPISIDFSTTDESANDVVSYDIINKPQDAVISPSTGEFLWTPALDGSYSFTVVVTDGTSVTTKNVKINVGKDRQGAMDNVTTTYNTNQSYVTTTLNTYLKVYNEVAALIQGTTDEVFCQGLLNLKTAVDGLQLLTPTLENGNMDYVKLVTSPIGNTNAIVDLNDNDWSTFIALTGVFYQTIDFGPNFKVTADAFAIQCRQGFPERSAGTAVFGSNDGENWTQLTDTTVYSIAEELQTLSVYEQYRNTEFRFFKIERIKNAVGNFINMQCFDTGEFQIFGQRHEMVNKISNVTWSSIAAPGTTVIKNRIVLGSTMVLTFSATEPISDIRLKIQGRDVIPTTSDNLNWTASLISDEDMPEGIVTFSLNYKTADKIEAEQVFSSTDGSSIYIVDESDVISNMISICNLIDSTPNRTPAVVLSNANLLFNNDISKSTDMRTSAGPGPYLIFDFKEGNQVVLSKVELLARQDNYYTRINGTIVQGSNDNVNWTTLTPKAQSTKEWQVLKVTSSEPYRYIRLYNAGSWYGNLSEARFHVDENY